MERLNYFNPYQSKAVGHEDQLTRAFLVVLRMVPHAFCGFLDLIRDKQLLAGNRMPLPSNSDLLTQNSAIQTQCSAVPQKSGQLISVLLTDQDGKELHSVQESARGARYDGVICFEETWIIVLENKPRHQDVWLEQVNPSLPSEEHKITIDPQLIVLRWPDVINRLSSLLNVKWLGNTDRLLIEDFLDFLNEHFPYLNPYDTFGRCKASKALLEKRCEAILNSLAPGRVKWQGLWSNYYLDLHCPAAKTTEAPVKRRVLRPVPQGEAFDIQLAMWPGDTMNQARAFYRHLADQGLAPFLNLREMGWELSTNFHFGFIQKGFGHGVRTTQSVDEYIRYWMDHVASIAQIIPDSNGFARPLQTLAAQGLISDSDVSLVSAEAAKLGATNMNVIPGLELSYRWSLTDAATIDKSKGGMVEEVRKKAMEAMRTWGGDFATNTEL